MKSSTPFTYRSEPPSASSANNMLDMVSDFPMYISISNELRIVLLKRVEKIKLDELEWRDLIEEYMQFKKRYYEYSFSYACFDATIQNTIQNKSNQNSWKFIVKLSENEQTPGILTFSDPNKLLSWLQLFGTKPLNEQIINLIYLAQSSTVQCLYEIVKDHENEGRFVYEYRLFVQLDLGMQYQVPVEQLILSDTVSDLPDFYRLFMQIIPSGISVNKGLQIVKNNKLLEEDEFAKRVNDDEHYENAKLFDKKLGVILDSYRDIFVSQENKEEIFNLICKNERWCFFIKQTNTMFTFFALESKISSRPVDTFRLFSPDNDGNKAVLTYEGQQRNKEMREMIILLNCFFDDQIKWRTINKLPYKKFCLVIAGEIIADDAINIAITFGGTKLKGNDDHKSFNKTYNKTLSKNELYHFLSAINRYFLDWDLIDDFYLGYDEGENDENDRDDDFDDLTY